MGPIEEAARRGDRDAVLKETLYKVAASLDVCASARDIKALSLSVADLADRALPSPEAAGAAGEEPSPAAGVMRFRRAMGGD